MKRLLLIAASLCYAFIISAQNELSTLLSEENYNGIISLLEPQKDHLKENENYILAFSFYQSGNLNQAISILKDGNFQATKTIDLLSKCYYETGQYPEALNLCQMRYTQDSTHYGNLMRYAQIQNIEGQYDSSISILTHYLMVDSLNYNANLLLGETYQKASEDLLAVDVYTKILRHYPNNQKVGFRLAQMYYGIKKYVECYDLCMEFVDTLGYSKNFLTMAAMSSFKSGANGNTALLFKRVEEHGDSSFITKKHIGIAYYRMENFETSLPYLYRAFELKDDDPEVCFFLGSSLAESNIPLKGKPYLERAALLISPSPDLMERIHLKLAMMHEDSGEYGKAIAYYDSAYRCSPGTAQYLYNQAVIYDYDLKNSAKAQEMYERFLDQIPDSFNTKKGKDLQQIRLKEIVDKRLSTLAEEAFFRQGLQ